jgi:hypothetical protein
MWKEPWAQTPEQMAEEVVEWLKEWRKTNKDKTVPAQSSRLPQGTTTGEDVGSWTKFDGLFLATDVRSFR